ncbi:hypothetical protein F4782DRAFT_79251 [Xylaria castorea]|nr:hypothetical protein F4782DRAFT_79251 [Xylaria castorea]
MFLITQCRLYRRSLICSLAGFVYDTSTPASDFLSATERKKESFVCLDAFLSDCDRSVRGFNSGNWDVGERHYRFRQFLECLSEFSGLHSAVRSWQLKRGGGDNRTMRRLVTGTRANWPRVPSLLFLCMTEMAFAFTILFDYSLCPCGGTTMRRLYPLDVASRNSPTYMLQEGYGVLRRIFCWMRGLRPRVGPKGVAREGCIDIPFDRTCRCHHGCGISDVRPRGKIGYSKRFLLHRTA